jgi:DNA invertase Pin-like site-specific DNA recombinase
MAIVISILDMLGVFAEFETNLRKERQLEASRRQKRPASTRGSAIPELRRQHPRLDWEGITEREGQWRRIARYWSEVKK